MSYKYWIVIIFMLYGEHSMAVKEVSVGALITDLRSFNYAQNSFEAIFYVWWNTTHQDYHPDQSVSIVNALSFDSKNNFQVNYEKDIYNTSLRYYATMHHHWDMKEFPFDRQVLKIKLEDDFNIDHIRFTPDLKNSRIAKEFILPGWQINSFTIKEEPFIYRTNFGNDKIDNATFSRVFLEIDIKRSGIREFINYFIVFFIAVFLIALAYFIYPSFTDAKFSLALSAIFAAMANKYILDGLLPSTPDFTLSDNIQLMSFAYIILGCSIFTIESILMRHNLLSLSLKINYIAFALSTLIYVVVLSYHILINILT